MNIAITVELQFFLISILWGVILLFAYDILRVIRRLIKHNSFFLAFEDLIFWVIASVFIFAMLYVKNNGIIRGFSVMGMGIGMVVYHYILSDWMVKTVTKLIYILLKPIKLLMKQLHRILRLIKLKVMKIIRFLLIRLKKRTKSAKIFLDKKKQRRKEKIEQQRQRKAEMKQKKAELKPKKAKANKKDNKRRQTSFKKSKSSDDEKKTDVNEKAYVNNGRRRTVEIQPIKK
ncbi:spore cortex biosynthesis protein YabQ [Mobilitalea sibirica]|uniref:Spore cortex biosynthesis protein YabQ n=1 Tax=Mobilitalea sibirica TaxID=1462919 RepID=A0A8J7KWP3_9FIRM|nr:spore cortex biosynthesis protein YabQ [Mobilitalea sibirica]MBH1940737.1 spore cortex biosynthesis protein YabQ [Mobilitalea sibirica]